MEQNEGTAAVVARSIITGNRYMTLATCDDHHAWASAVAYAYSADLCFYWFSAVDARHSRNLRHNSQISAAIFNSTEPSDTVDGLQLLGTADEAPVDELQDLIDLYFTQSFPDPDDRARWLKPRADFEGAAIQRFYRFRPTSIWKIDNSATDVDRRQEVDMAELRALSI